MTRTAGAMIAMLCATSGRAQTPAFEVASVKLSDPNAEFGALEFLPGGRFNATNVPLQVIILRAYNIRDFQLLGRPDSLKERYSIQAKAPEGSFGDAQIRLMVQTLLAERFQLKSHREMKGMPVYVLVAGKNGPKIHTAKDEIDIRRAPVAVGRGSITATNTTFAMVATALSRILDRPVLDETQLTGNYDFKLHYDQSSVKLPFVSAAVPKPEPDNMEPSIFTAVEEQLGLKLVAQKKAVEVLVIDSVERPSGNE